MAAVTPTSYTVNADQLASQYLQALGWPNTAANQRALAAWFMAESPHNAKAGTVTVVGNNPLNISHSPMQNGYWLAGGGKQQISTFSSPAAGALALKQRLSLSSYNYPGIVTAFGAQGGTSQDGELVINAIINSGWVTGKPGSYQHGHSNSLLSIYRSLPGGSAALIPTGPLSGGGNGSGSGSTLTADQWNNVIAALPPGTRYVSPTNIPLIIAAAKAQGLDLSGFDFTPFTAACTTGQCKSVSDLRDALAAKGIIPGANLIPTNFFGWFTSRILGVGAMVAGGVLTMFGLYLLTKEATSGSSAQSIVSPVPVFLREGA